MTSTVSALRCSSRNVFRLSVAALLLLLLVAILLNLEHVSNFTYGKALGVQSRFDSPPSAQAQEQEPVQVTLPSHWRTTEVEKLSSGWAFDSERDSENCRLNEAECNAAFPGFLQEINRSMAYWNQSRIGPRDLDIGWKDQGLTRAMVFNRRLYILEHKFSGAGYNIHRTLAVLGSINRAVNSYSGQIPNTEFSFSVSDIADSENESGGRPVWTFSRRDTDKHQWLMPDFGFWSWGLDLVGEYSQIRGQMLRYEKPLPDKIDRLLWRGAENSDIRRKLLKVTSQYRSTWADVWPVSWSGRTKLAQTSSDIAISIPEHCRWRFLMHTEGVSYSGRGKYLLNCHSVVFAHHLGWIENWHSLLVPEGPEQNFVQVKDDLSDLSNKVEYLLAYPDEAERIANNSVAIFRNRYLTPAAQACYWRALVRAWRDVSFEPNPYENVNEMSEAGSVMSTTKQVRGTPYETFILTAFDDLYSKCSWLKEKFGLC